MREDGKTPDGPGPSVPELSLDAAGDAARTALADGKLIAWCTTHNDLAWLYDDGSVGCYHCLVVETGSGDCEAVPLKLAGGSAGLLPIDLEAIRDLLRYLGTAPGWDRGIGHERLSYSTYKQVWEAGRRALKKLERLP